MASMYMYSIFPGRLVTVVTGGANQSWALPS